MESLTNEELFGDLINAEVVSASALDIPGLSGQVILADPPKRNCKKYNNKKRKVRPIHYEKICERTTFIDVCKNNNNNNELRDPVNNNNTRDISKRQSKRQRITKGDIPIALDTDVFTLRDHLNEGSSEMSSSDKSSQSKDLPYPYNNILAMSKKGISPSIQEESSDENNTEEILPSSGSSGAKEMDIIERLTQKLGNKEIPTDIHEGCNGRRNSELQKTNETENCVSYCFGCGWGFKPTKTRDNPLNTLLSIFTDNYLVCSNVELSQRMALYYEKKIYLPAIRSGNKNIPKWPCKMIQVHIEEHMIDPLVNICENIKRCKEISYSLEEHLYEEVTTKDDSGNETMLYKPSVVNIKLWMELLKRKMELYKMDPKTMFGYNSNMRIDQSRITAFMGN